MDAIYAEATNKTLGGILRTHVKAALRYNTEADSLLGDSDAYEDRSAFVKNALKEIQRVAGVIEVRRDGPDGPVNARRASPAQRAEGSVWLAIGVGFVFGLAARAFLS